MFLHSFIHSFNISDIWIMNIETAETETEVAEKSSRDQANRGGKNLVWFGEIERKLAKLSKTTFAYRSSSYLFYDCNSFSRCKMPFTETELFTPLHTEIVNFLWSGWNCHDSFIVRKKLIGFYSCFFLFSRSINYSIKYFSNLNFLKKYCHC